MRRRSRGLDTAVETHLITSHHLLPLLIDEPGGLLVEVTDGTTDFNASSYRISVFYDLAKVAVNRLAFSRGQRPPDPRGATAVSTSARAGRTTSTPVFGARR